MRHSKKPRTCAPKHKLTGAGRLTAPPPMPRLALRRRSTRVYVSLLAWTCACGRTCVQADRRARAYVANVYACMHVHTRMLPATLCHNTLTESRHRKRRRGRRRRRRRRQQLAKVISTRGTCHKGRKGRSSDGKGCERLRGRRGSSRCLRSSNRCGMHDG